MKVKNFIGKSVNGFTVINTYKVILPSGATTRKVLLKCDDCGREFERNSGVDFNHIKCKCKCGYLKPKKSKFVKFELNGKVYTQTELCENYDINVNTFKSRLKNGLTVEQALQKTFICKCEICHKEFTSNRPNKK